jgi:hypothetical protein
MNEQSDFYYDQLFAAAFSMPEVRESRSGVWTYTFTSPPLEFTNISFRYRGHSPAYEHVRTRDPRAIRLRKIKRRQKRAAYRRKKRGLA